MLGTFVICAFLAGALEVHGEIECGDPSACRALLPEKRGVPDSVEEFDNHCPHMIEYFNCLEEYMKECGSEYVPDAETVPDLLVYLRDACDKESETYKGIKKYLPCLQSHLHSVDEDCRETSNTALDSYADANQITIEEDPIFRMHSTCYRILSGMACFTAQIEEKCEDGAKDFLFDMLRRVKYINNICHEQDQYLLLLEELELNAVMKDRIRELIEA